MTTEPERIDGMHPHAYHAVRAVRYMLEWGEYATLRYLEKRGVPFALVKLAARLDREKEEK